MDRRSFLKLGAASLVAANVPSNIVNAQTTATTNSPSTNFGPVTCENIKAGKDDLKIHFLGTGAAGWKPDVKSPTNRRNSSIIVDDKFFIDFTISIEDMIPEGLKLTDVLYTHSHGDHYQPKRAVLYGFKKVYVSDTWVERAKEDFKKAADETGKPMPEVIGLKLGKTFNLHGIDITPLPANHATDDFDEQAHIYLLEKGTTADKLGVRLLYATDTGGLMGRASRRAGFDGHKVKSITPKALTGFIMEATMGINREGDFRIFNHSDASQVGRIVNMLIETERYIAPKGQPAYITHLAYSLHDKKSQDEINRTLPTPLRAAYDGLVAVFKPVE